LQSRISIHPLIAMQPRPIPRREFLKVGLATALPAAALTTRTQARASQPRATADAVIFVWLPGGVAQADTWDPKRHTPFRAGMRGSDLLGTCPAIDTSLDGLQIGAGLEEMAQVMHHATVLRSLASETKFGAVHLKAQYYMMTGYLFPVGVKAPGMGAVVARTLGPRDPRVPPYIYLGRDIDTSDTEKQFISEYVGPGFYGPKYAPLMVPDPVEGLASLETTADMTPERLDRRLRLLQSVHGLADERLRGSAKVEEYLRAMQSAREMMDSPVKQALDYQADERPATLAAYEPRITAAQVKDKKYFYGRRFGHGLLVARRLVEAGARFVQVEYQYGAFKGFDTHEDGALRMVELKKQIDGPLAQLVRDLDERGMLDRTLVVVATEFGRTIANQPKAGVEPIGFAEAQSGDDLVIENEKMYGFHGHFSSANTMLFFGGGFKRGLIYGRTADRHPLLPVENPVALTDVHATIYRALGIAADTAYETEGRPFHVTKDGKGRAIEALLA
jgi:hypothetical protein